MKQLLRQLFALSLAILLLLPSVHLATYPQTALAVEADLDWTQAATDVTTDLLTCKIGGWAAGLLEEVMGAFGSFIGFSTGPITSTVETVGAAAGQTLTLGPTTPTGTEVIGGKNPLLNKQAWGKGMGAAATIAVPTSDIYLQEQNAWLSEQLASVQRNTGVVADAAVQSATHDATDVFKECVLDPFATALKNIIIDAVTDSIVAWIEGGFYGAPSFVEDPSKFFTDVADYSVSAFLYESGLDELLCEPFRLDLVLDLSWDFYMPDMDPEYGRLSCSLDEVFPGVDVTIGIDDEGNPITARGYAPNEAYEEMTRKGNIDFPGGGFPAVMGMLRDSNNEIGAKFEAQSSGAEFASRQVSRESTLLTYGKGWFSTRCKTPGKPDTAPDSVCTPGEWVSEQVNDWSGGQLAQLELADEFAEIMNALLKLMVEKILSEGNNLLTYRR